MAARVLARTARIGVVVGRLIAAKSRPEPISNGIHGLKGYSMKLFSSNSSSTKCQIVPSKTNQLLRLQILANESIYQRFGYSSSASPESNEKDASQPADQDKSEVDKNNNESAAQEEKNNAGTSSDSTNSNRKRRRNSKRIAFSDSDEEVELSRDDLIKLVAEKEEQLNLKHKEIEKMQDKVLRSYAEMENVIERTKRESENSKKFAIQSFAKSLLDVADNLGRASSVVKESFLKIDVSKDSAGAFPLLKTLLEGVEMTDKQLAEVFKKFGLEKFDPVNEQFDPNRHNAVFQVPDPSKPSGTVAVVLKSGYMLYDRVIRPAEVGVTPASDESSESSST